MRRWYVQYLSTLAIGQQAVDQMVFRILFSIPLGCHILLLTKTLQEAYFYIMETIRNNWSRGVLQLQIED